MNPPRDVTDASIDRLYQALKKDAENAGYHLNPDELFTRELARGLAINEARYGYRACPCRLAAGNKKDDLDIICPCSYRDPDLMEYEACYCGLYVSPRVLSGEAVIRPIPERRPDDETRNKIKESGPGSASAFGLSLPVWRCSVCGYLCARHDPPHLCPICKADKERFERFM